MSDEQNRAIRNVERAKVKYGVRTVRSCELVEPKADRINIDIPRERQLRQRRVEQLIRYDRARMAARLNGARMAEYLPREPRGGILIKLVRAWVRLWSGR